MPVITPPAEMPAAELSTINNCLAGIRRRIFLIRLTERLIIAVAWGAALGACLTGSRLLHEGALRFEITRPGLGWCALLISVLPLVMAAWAFRKSQTLRKTRVNGVTTITADLALAASILTALFSIASVALLFAKLGGTLPVWLFAAAPVALFIAIAAATVRMIDARAAAIFVDRQVGLHERVSTALEMLQSPAQSSFETSFRVPVITSAVGACQQVRTALQSRNTRLGFARLDQRAYAVAALAALAAAGVTLFQPLPAQARATHKISVIAVNQAKALEKVMQELEKTKPPTDKTDQHLQPLKDAITRLQDGNMSPLEANAVLSEAKDQMKRDQDAMKAADKVQEMLKQMQETQDLAKASDDMKNSEASKADGEANAGTQAAQEMKNAAEAMANKAKGGSADDRKDLSSKLQDAANKAGADPQLQKDLQNAADAAQSGDSQKLAASMQSAGDRMSQQMAASQSNSASMQKAMSEIDRLQDQAGSQSTMADGNQNNQGNNGGQSGSQGGQSGQQGDKGQQAGGQSGGQQGGGQKGDGQQGDGQQAGEGEQASGAGQGKGNGSQSSGNGSTMMQANGGPSPDKGPIGGVGSFVRIYDERVTANNGSTEKVGSKINPLAGPANGSVDILGPADKNDPNFKTYSEVMADSRQRAMDELSRQDIPPQYRDMVKEFYEDPAKK